MRMKYALKALPEILLALTAFAALSFAYPAVPTTYTYTGNPFTDVNAPYTTSMFVTAMVTLANPLAPNMPLQTASVTAFTLSDGVQTITNLTSSSFLIQFATGPTGAITAWAVNATMNGSSITSFYIPDPLSDFDQGTSQGDTGRGETTGPRALGQWRTRVLPYH
jgi:hypothetical protein